MIKHTQNEKKSIICSLAVSLSLCGFAQIKGINVVSLGITSYSNKSDYGVRQTILSKKQIILPSVTDSSSMTIKK